MIDSRRALAALVCAVVVGAAPGVCGDARAQACGDADTSDSVDVVDTANVRRAAVGLSSTCFAEDQTAPLPACDLDGSGTVNVLDGANMGRLAVGLPASSACTAEIENFLGGILIQGDDGGGLNYGFAPLPTGETPIVTISSTEGPGEVAAGQQAAVTVTYDLSGVEGAQQANAGEMNLVVSIAVQDPEFRFVPGFFEIPVDAPSGTVTLDVTYSDELAGQQPFLFCPATRDAGALSAYDALPQSPQS